MKFAKKTYVFIGLMSATSIAAQVYHPATECPLLKDNPQAEASVVPATSIPPLEPTRMTPISTMSQPSPLPLRSDQVVSPPFETPETIVTVTAGAGVAIAPSRVTSSPAPSLNTEIVLIAEAETEMTPDMTKDTPANAWNAALSKYVSAPGASGLAKFDYAGLKASKKDMKALDAYIVGLEASGTDGLSDAQATVFWANLYNAVTIQVVTEAYPVSSIKKVQGGLFGSGPWKKDLITVNGKKMSLDDVEHKTLRKKYPSPLIHYMVNCASVGCPNLKDGLWRAETMDAEREKAARDYINSPRGAKITDKGLVVSSIYDWFAEDFGGNKSGVLAHLSEYAEGDLKTAIDGGVKISGYDYDWSLNE